MASSEMVEELIRSIAGTDILALELKWGDHRVRMVQGASLSATGTIDAALPVPSTLVTINAPLTGVFYARPAPDQPPFLVEGITIEPGQVVGLIETMKLFNEVVSEVTGIVRESLVAEGDLVQKDQPLIRVEPKQEPA